MVKQYGNNKNSDKNNTLTWKITKNEIIGGKKIDEPKEKTLLFHDWFFPFKQSGLFCSYTSVRKISHYSFPPASKAQVYFGWGKIYWLAHYITGLEEGFWCSGPFSIQLELSNICIYCARL